MSCYPITCIINFLLNSSIYICLFYGSSQIYQICQPIAPPDQSLLGMVLLTELFRTTSSSILSLCAKTVIMTKNTPFLSPTIIKYLVLLIFKIIIISSKTHRLLYYLYFGIAQFLIFIVLRILSSSIGSYIEEVGQIIIVHLIHFTSMILLLTGTLCPSLVISFFMNNLMILCCLQIQKQYKQGPKACLYVKNDIYRILMLTFIYITLKNLFQLIFLGNYNHTLILLLILLPFYQVLKNYNSNKLAIALCYLFITVLIISVGQLLIYSSNRRLIDQEL